MNKQIANITKDTMWYLQNFDFFNDISPKAKEILSEKAWRKDFKKNDFIYYPQDQPNEIFLVKMGKVKIGSFGDQGKEVLKTILEEGEVFGEQFILGEDKRNDFAQAMTDCCMLLIKREDFEELMANNIVMSTRLMKIIGERLRKLEKKFEQLIFKDSRSRIIEFIKEMATEKGTAVGYETLILHTFTHQDIANITATSRQTVTTVLNNLKENNLIYFDRKRILVRDLNKLE